MKKSLSEGNWKILLSRINEEKCTPFFGAGACYGTLPLANEIAEELASEYNYPLNDKND